MMQNGLLLLKESCKFVSKKLQGDALLGQLDEYEFEAIRSCIELEEMEKEISGRPVVMRAYANQELKEVEGWLQRLLNAWKQISLDLIIERLTEMGVVFCELLSALSSSAPDVTTTVHNALAKLNDDLSKHPVFRGFLLVKRDHIAQHSEHARAQVREASPVHLVPSETATGAATPSRLTGIRHLSSPMLAFRVVAIARFSLVDQTQLLEGLLSSMLMLMLVILEGVRNGKNIKPSLPKDKQQPVEASTRKPSSGKVQKAGGGNASSVYPAEKLRLGI